MTDTQFLRKKIQESGLKMQSIAERLGLTYQGFLNKMNNVREFKASELLLLKELLRLSEKEFNSIFFAV